MLAIRRLLDRRPDVISLRRLLEDVSRWKGLFTREIYVCYDGLPYEPGDWQSLPATVETQMFGIQAPGLSKYHRSWVRHEAFDKLSGTEPDSRKRTDRIRDEICERIQSWIDNTPANRLVVLSHKFFAHAAAADSRGTIAYSGIKLAEIAEIHRALVRVERAITDQILFVATAQDVVPMPPLGMFKGLDSPYAPSSSVEDMDKEWDRLSQERNTWLQGIADELIA